MNIDAMKELLAAVEAGEVVQAADARAIWPELDIWGAVCCASQGSTDAALALHGALLPDSNFVIAKHCDWFHGEVWNSACEESVFSEAPTPARVLLIATLRGKIAKMEGTTT